MGRELKRVPLDFDWEIGKLWCGYINPHPFHKCRQCDGTGESADYKRLHDEWYAFDNEDYRPNPYNSNATYNANAWNHDLTKEDVAALLAADRLWDFTRVPRTPEQEEIVKKKMADGGNSWLPFNNGYVPTPEEVNEWSLKSFGHDSSNAWYCVKARLKREGKPLYCAQCKGSGAKWQHPKAKSLYQRWKPYDPPTGDGYQLWSTTSEGNPMTPVFATLEELCEYCEKERVSVFGRSTATKGKWIEMLDADFVCYKEGNTVFI